MSADDELGQREKCLNHKENDLLEILLDRKNEKEWERRMVPAEYAYHVTNVPGKDDIPTFSKLKWHLANDFKYDRQLVGLPCVFFTTTRLKKTAYDGLLDESPYPARSKKGEKHWRVCVHLHRFKEYDIWYCKHPAKSTYDSKSMYQVRLILTKDVGERKYIENIPDIIELKKEEKNPFLYYNNKEGKWYTNNYYTYKIQDHINYDINYIVNFVVLKNVSLEGLGPDVWDQVPRSKMGPGNPLNSELLAAAVIRKWSAYRKSQNSIEQKMDKLDLSGGSNPKKSK